MSFEDFKANCACHGITDDDGSGVWMKGDEVSDVYLESSDFGQLNPPPWATQICWYNK